MKIGVDYYPEQWNSEIWNKDAELMARTGVKVVRMGEFAWSELEPRENEYRFEWLDEAVSIFSRFGFEIVMGIPTNCPPLWFYQKYPESVQQRGDGKTVQTGIRGHRCINSPVFMEYARKITLQMVRRYSENKNIKYWQIDNEPEAYPCTCEVCRDKFRKWLLDKHDSIEEINEAFGNTVWSNKYSDESQIMPPTAYPKNWQNPALCLEYYRFCCESVNNYVRELAFAVKREIPKAKVTTNVTMTGDIPDFFQLFDKLDFVSYDNYPPIRIPKDKEAMYSSAFYLDMMRGVKQDKFWVMEQLSGSTGSWSPMSPSTRPGMIMGYSLQALAHGADTVLHFRWRTAPKGAEMFWHGLIDHSGVPGRRFFEFSELCKTASKLSVIDTTQIVSDIAILYSPESNYAMKIQPQVEGLDYLEQLKLFHSAFSRYGANVDIISADADLSDYKVVVVPALFVTDKSVSENIYRYVIKGGTAILTDRCGVKDSMNNCIQEQLPTVFRELIGAEVTEYDPIGNQEQLIVDFAGNAFTCTKWCDVLQLTTARAYAEYDENYYRTCPAVTMNRYCSGVAYYVGTVCKSDFYESFAGNIMKQAGIPRLKGLPRGVEVTTRTNGLDDYIFFFNNSEEHAVINLPKAMYSIIDSAGKDKISLSPFAMDIVRK